MPRKLHGIDCIQMTEPDLLFRDVSLYTETLLRRRWQVPFIKRSPLPTRAVASPA
jgi:hypothetical protein